MIGAIVGEFSAASGPSQFGLGYLIMQTWAQLKTDYLFASVLAAMLMGVAIFAAVSLVGELVLKRWYRPTRGHGPAAP